MIDKLLELIGAFLDWWAELGNDDDNWPSGMAVTS